ncbi:phosphotransferase enzyme family protein [Paenibacillus aquistagni]|uniref:Phosphotransferase enzyme family protein n=1 Tax=Paenibacillus aquistagni TaxID=1852522 RepID=A0A1X7J0C1_9BACL|nr:phosphotransferase [Paenibacillus aquistagni]SMG20539.1 Phosphotransferase enzyme family protein [Paenibacillus aquistagni]
MLRKEGLKQAASYFRFDADTVKMISQSTNVVYQCNRQHKPMILRISESGRCAASIEAELEWIHYLSSNGVHVSTPIRGVDGQYILRVDAEHEMCLVTAFEMANGQCCDPCNAALWGRDIFIKWGEVMGRMHALAKSYVPQLAVRKEWEQTHIDNSWLRQGDYLFILNKLEQYERSFLCFHKDSDAYGLIPTFMDNRNTASYFWWLKDWDGNEESLTDFQRHAVSYAGHLIRSGQCFDGCDIEI